MKGKPMMGISLKWWGILTILMLPAAVQGQVLRGELDNIRRQNDLTADDLQLLRTYINSQFRLMENARDIQALKNPLLELDEITTSSGNPQARQLYADEFAQSVKQVYSRLWQRGQNLAQQQEENQQQLGENIKLAVVTVLVMCDHPSLIPELTIMLQDKSALVRACAVKGFSRDNMRQQLIQGNATDQLAGILSRLNQQLDFETSAEVFMRIAEAATLSDNAQSVALMQKCITKRVEQYQSWQVKNETADAEILKWVFLAAQQKVTANDRRTATILLQSAAELYTAAFYRYRTGKAYSTPENKVVSLLSSESQQALKSLLCAGEERFMQICNRPSTNRNTRAVFMALQDGTEVNLPKAFNSVLGPGGMVQQAFNIYDGWKAPGELPPPSAEIVQKAENLQKIKANSIIG